MPAQALRYTQLDTAPQYDALGYWWDLVKGGWWSLLKPAEKSVLSALYAHADPQTGRTWPSIDTLMLESGYGRRAVETARTSLAAVQRDPERDGWEDLGGTPYRPALVELVRRGGWYQSSVYRMTMPPNRCALPRSYVRGYPAATCATSRTHVRSTPQLRAGKEAKQETREAAAASTSDRGLWDGPPPVEREAAAALISLGIEARRARGLVTEYRPTPQQAENLAANVRAKQQAAERGQSDRIRDLYGFVRAQCREGRYSLDDRVVALRRREVAKTRIEAATQKRADQAKAQRDHDQAVKQAEDQTWASLSDDVKNELRTSSLLGLSGRSSAFHERLSNNHPMMRGLILAEASKRGGGDE